MEVRRCTACGEELPVIPQISQLHRALAQVIIEQRVRLSGADIRFLREYLGHSRQGFANLVGVARETLSRWEKGKDAIGPSADRLLRLLVVQEKRVENYDVAHLSRIDEGQAPNFRMSRSGSDWLACA